MFEKKYTHYLLKRDRSILLEIGLVIVKGASLSRYSKSNNLQGICLDASNRSIVFFRIS